MDLKGVVALVTGGNGGLGQRICHALAQEGAHVAVMYARSRDQAAGVAGELRSRHQVNAQAFGCDITDGAAVDRLVGEASAGDYDALILPGGAVNPDNLRQHEAAVGFVRDFVNSGKPVGVICHGPWTLVEADVVQGRTLTSYPSVRTDIRNAGGKVIDAEVVTDQNITSSRWPDDCRRSVPGSWSSSPRAHDEIGPWQARRRSRIRCFDSADCSWTPRCAACSRVRPGWW